MEIGKHIIDVSYRIKKPIRIILDESVKVRLSVEVREHLQRLRLHLLKHDIVRNSKK